jgi:VWFA-related protein
LTGVCSTGLAQEREPADVIKINTDLVVFDAQVIDKKTKRVIDDLTREDFEITDGGVRQQVSYLSRDELPLSIMLLLDVSGSVRPVIHRIRDGALGALQHLRAQDQVAVMAFATSSELVQDFTKDRKLVSEKIEAATASERLGRGTVLGPALDDAALKMATAPQTSRCVIIVITDNIVLTWPPQEKKILQELFDRGSVVYGLIISGSVFTALGTGATRGVNEYVEQTGGEILNANKNDVDAKLALVINRLRARYVIGFRPTDTTEDGTFRRVEIRITSAQKNPDKPLVLTKRGYYFRRPPQ